MTKEALRMKLEAGRIMDELFHYTAGQQCTIYKAAAFTTGDEVIYIFAILATKRTSSNARALFLYKCSRLR